jgi:Fanconi anemia group M protein
MEEADVSRYLDHPLVKPEAIEFRSYQKQISDVAFEKNTLVILPTALGKTIIAVIVAANVLYQYKDAKVLMMAPTRPLVMQHRDSFFEILKLRKKDVCLLTGEIPPSRRKGLWSGGARLFFSTPQVVRNDLRSGRLDLWDFGLVVFDECHRAVKRYAYTDIASLYFSHAKYPLILGMTASPGSELERVLKVCENLYIEQVEYRTEEDPDVKSYIQSINMEWMTVKLPEVYLAARAQIRSILDRRLKWLRSWGVVKNNPRFVFRRELIKAGHELRYNMEESIEEERGRFFAAIINQSVALTLQHMLELLETQGMHSLGSFLNKVEIERKSKRSYAIIAKDPRYVALRDLLERSYFEHPKAKLLLNIVEEQISDSPDSRMLVFTQYRDTASHLVDLLSEIPEVKADRFVGQAFKLADAGLTQEEQTELIMKLREGELNVLVATSIAEEGLDIPEVDHVVFYEPIPNEIRYIQRRGRTGRRSAGKVTILATEGTMDIAYLRVSRRKAEKMKRIATSANTKLQDIDRNTPRPPPNPLTETELRLMEGKPDTGDSDEILILDDEEEIFIIDDDESCNFVDIAAKDLYTKILERGIAGVGRDRLVLETEREGISSSNLRARLQKLVKDGLITESATRRYLATSSLKSTGKTHEIKVEKIKRGYAIVNVDSVLSAILTPEDYEGPRNLIKKNSRFRASSILYSFRGTLYIRVNEIIEIIN